LKAHDLKAHLKVRPTGV